MGHLKLDVQLPSTLSILAQLWSAFKPCWQGLVQCGLCHLQVVKVRVLTSLRTSSSHASSATRTLLARRHASVPGPLFSRQVPYA